MLRRTFVGGLAAATALGRAAVAQGDPLPSWNDGPARRDWLVVDMKRDWKVVFPFESGR